MARGSSYGENTQPPPLTVTRQTIIPRRATRELPALNAEEERQNHKETTKQT